MLTSRVKSINVVHIKTKILFFTGKTLSTDVKQFCKKYNSDVVSVNIYGQLTVFLNSYDLIKDTFMKRADVSDRMPNSSFQRIDPGYGGKDNIVLCHCGSSLLEKVRRSTSLY